MDDAPVDPAYAHTVASDATSTGDEAPPLPKGAVCGRYMIVDVLGHGAMGVVYAAYDPELDRKVALKLMKRGFWASGDERARIQREAQAMARLSHPNVVAVYDVGIFDEQVFIAMELVRGKTLRRWLEAPRSQRDIVDMFVQVGRGVAAAHAAGVIHRDLKPDNVLVGDDGRARVVDFGVARAQRHRSEPPPSLTSSLGGMTRTLDASLTREGSLVGTPRYMAPEQIGGELVDQAADQFAYCVSLWDALYRQPPFDGSDLLTLLSNVRDGRIREPPARGVPRWLRAVLERGLAPYPEDRHASMDAVLAALTRDRTAARGRLLAGLGVVALVSVAVVAGRAAGARRAPLCPSAEGTLAGVWDDDRRAAAHAAFLATKKPFAESAFRGAAGALDAYAAGWTKMHGEACEATLVRGQQSSELMDLRMACLDDRLASLRAISARFTSADDDAVLGATQAANALPPLSDCADAAALRAPVREPDDPALRARIAAARAKIAAARATRMTRKAPADVEDTRATVDEARQIAWGPLTAEALIDQGRALLHAHDEKNAEAALHEGQLGAVASGHRTVERQAWVALAYLYGVDVRKEPGKAAAEQAQACLDRDGDDGESLAALRQAEARLAFNDGAYDVAIARATESLELRQRRLGPDHPDVAASLNELGLIAYRKGDKDAALDYHRRALAIREKAFGADHPAVAVSLANIANTLAEGGQYEEAIGIQMRVMGIFAGAFGEESRFVSDVLNDIGAERIIIHQAEWGLSLLQQSLAMRQKLLGPDSPPVAQCYGNMADGYLDLQRWDEAIAAANKRIDILQRANGADFPPLSRAQGQIGVALVGKKKVAEAMPYLERALRLAETGKAGPTALPSAQLDLARALVAGHGDQARARDLAKKARAAYAALGDQLEVAEVDRDFPPAVAQ
jgi:tetratricopeptide (TPR) repeat protein